LALAFQYFLPVSSYCRYWTKFESIVWSFNCSSILKPN